MTSQEIGRRGGRPSGDKGRQEESALRGGKDSRHLCLGNGKVKEKRRRRACGGTGYEQKGIKQGNEGLKFVKKVKTFNPILKITATGELTIKAYKKTN